MRIAEMIEGSLREDNPVSFSRLITFILVAFVLGWDTSYVVYALINAKFLAHNASDFVATVSNALPNVTTLAAQGVFMSLFYGVNKVTGAYSSKQDVPKP